MDCNKEEAIRAKEIAESKMKNKDFVGARKIALKAQQLFPDLENISQLMAVCDVHCSALIKIISGETDWYAVLQVPPTADETLIKKQFRKFALLLHPDKNKLSGAEAAFKLIGEAHTILLDKGKRSLHDVRRSARCTAPSRPPSQQTNMATVGRHQPSFVNNFTANISPTGLHQQQHNLPTFWTICSNCSMRFQYYTTILNKSIRCQNCLQFFTAFDLSAQAAAPFANTVPYGVSSKGAPMRSDPNTVQQDQLKGAASGMGVRLNGHGSSETDLKKGTETKFDDVELNKSNNREHAAKNSGNVSRKRKMVVEESSDGESAGSDSTDIIDDHAHEFKAAAACGDPPRRSTRNKQNVTYNEIESDDDVLGSHPRDKSFKKRQGAASNSDQNDEEFLGSDGDEIKARNIRVDTQQKVQHKQAGLNGSRSAPDSKMNGRPDGAEVKEELPRATATQPSNDTVDLSCNSSTKFSYPDPEFFDFESLRHENKFAVDQIWSVYDNLDGMPRFYARIRSVKTPGFKLRYTWLEPLHETETVWFEEDLPVSCGSFKLGSTVNGNDRLTFCEPMTFQKGSQRNSYAIYPRKGEIWALYKDWNIGWISDPANHLKYQYDLVEVLSDYEDGGHIIVNHLVRIKGFVCLFSRAFGNGETTIKIPSSEMLRFSHRVPSFRMTGKEREGIPAYSVELDTASLPQNLDAFFPPVSLDEATARAREESVGAFSNTITNAEKCFTVAGNRGVQTTAIDDKLGHEVHMKQCGHASSEMHSTAETSKKPKEVESMVQSGDKHSHSQGLNSVTVSLSERHCADSYQYPDSEFCCFDEDKSFDKFHPGQVWALYNEDECLPKYYAIIEKLDPDGNEISVAWLECCTRGAEEAQWKKRGLAVSCGTFKVASGKEVFDTTDVFSHLVQVKPSGRRYKFDIFPNSGEVWAVYRNWDIGWTKSNLENCEYDIVEVLSRDSSGVQAQVLTKVDGYKAVFMHERKGGALSKIDIPPREYLRFSYQIPAFKLTEERGGKLRGSWELDQASVPETVLCPK